MRKLPVLLLFVCLAAVAQGQAADAVELVSPTSLAITPTSGVFKVKVFYTAPLATKITVTDVGELVAGTHIGFVKQSVFRPYSFDLRFDLRTLSLKPGEAQTGGIVFAPPPGKGDPVTIPITVTLPSPAFTATATPTDICFACGEPRVINVQITNSGQAPLRKVFVGTVLMSDASRRHRWILPRSQTRRCDQPPANEVVKDGDGGFVVEPCTSVDVDLRPGEARTISVSVEPPQFGGDYATTMELSADGVPTMTVSLVTRVRGPRGGRAFPWPALLFFLTVLLGFVAAQLLEMWFGAGGVARRTKALIALHRLREELVAIEVWAKGVTGLTRTLIRIGGDIAGIDALIRDASVTAPEKLEQDTVPLSLNLQKRRRLRSRVSYALANGMADKVPELDEVPDAGTPEDYDKLLGDVLTGEAGGDRAALEEVFRGERALQKSEGEKLRARYRKMLVWRGALLFVVSLITAYGAFYGDDCNFGSVWDYFTLFLWALGLTQAGNALTNEIRSRAPEHGGQPQA